MTEYRLPAPGGVARAFAGHVTEWAHTVWQRWKAARRQAATHQALATLSDATLRDLGIARCELAS